MIATSTPAAVEAGRQILAAGGSAADATVAAAAALVVTEPTGCGLGGDAFAIVSPPEAPPQGLNASGCCPRALSARDLRGQGLDAVPPEGWLPVTVPGIVSGWWALHQRHGRLPWARVLEPSRQLAREGFEVSPAVAAQWEAGGARRFGGREGFEPFTGTWLLPGPRAPAAGESFRNPDLADTLEHLARGGREAFYQDLAVTIATHARDTGGFLTREDLAAHQEEWVDPVPVRYHGATVWELPPSGQGLVASLALALADPLPVPSGEQLLAPSRLHRLAECLRQAIAVGRLHLADPRHMTTSVAALLEPGFVDRLRAAIRPDTVLGDPGTVYLAVADADGMLVSWIQSNYMGFGSGMVVPGTGISMQNRGCGFTLEPGHPNELQPGKRPFHTIIPAYLEHAGRRAAFGVMGGPMQPQGHIQVATALLDHQVTPQEACALPRFRVLDGRRICLEAGIPEATREALARLGHELTPEPGPWAFGGAQMVLRHPGGTLEGGSDPRKDGHVARA